MNSSKTIRRLAAFALLASPAAAGAAVTAQVIRVENPTGVVMEWQEIEVFGGGSNLVLRRPGLFSGTTVSDHDIRKSEGAGVTDGLKDTGRRGPGFNVPAGTINPWFEIDLGRPAAIEKIILHGSRYPEKLYLDKGHRVLCLLDAARRVVWASKWNYYDAKDHPGGVFTFAPAAAPGPLAGRPLPKDAPDWVPMGWLLGAEEERPPPDADARMRRFAERNAPDRTEQLAREFFRLIEDDVPELEAARSLFREGRHAAALESWKHYWFAKMQRVHRRAAIRQDYLTYGAQGDDLLNGIAVTIGPTSVGATRFTPGRIRWIDLPDPKDAKALQNALTDCEQKAKVGKATFPLLNSYRRNPDAAYLLRWAEMMDDWSLNFFEDAAGTPYEVEMLFTFSPATEWTVMMEDLADAAAQHPQLVGQLPAATLARVQLLCLEKYSTAWWRQARETVFNHVTGGIYAWDALAPYIDEFRPGRRAAREGRQQFERWMTLGTEPDGSMTEIGDEGHFAITPLLGFPLARLEQAKEPPAWYTPGWRNRAMEWYDNIFAYMYRHYAPGGFDHRYECARRPERWANLTKPYFPNHPQNPPLLDRSAAVFAVPEIRRILDALGHVSSDAPLDPSLAQARDEILAVLGGERPGAPRINSDWMPYTGQYYFRSGWEDDAAFLGMMACGSHGGSGGNAWPFGMYYFYDHHHPLLRSQPLTIDGLPPNQLAGRVFEPGTKTAALTCAEEKPAPFRWHSSPHFDLGEAVFRGPYQRLPSFRNNWDHALEQIPSSNAIEGVTTTRRILQLRDSRLFVVTDTVVMPDAGSHQFSVPFKVALSSKQKGATKPFSAAQLQLDDRGARVRSENPDGPSVSLHQFAGVPVSYRRGKDAALDFRSYAARLGPATGIAEQEVFADFQGGGSLALVSLLASRTGAEDRLESVEALNRGGSVAGFHARTRQGREIWLQVSAAGGARLACGPVEALGETLLVERGPDALRGLVLGAAELRVAGRQIPLTNPDFEFASAAPGFSASPILRPVDPVGFLPNRNTFADSETVEMVSRTPGVEIRYTTDGSRPTRQSKLYTGPIRITASTEFAARAYRTGVDAGDDFEINGTRFTQPTYGWFHRRPMLPAADIGSRNLLPGLQREVVSGPWWKLYASLHWLPADGAPAAVPREMDLSGLATNEPYGVRFHGVLKIPADGVYTFHAPRELVHMDRATSYDLRLYVDGGEWDLTQWWHGRGTWSVPLQRGFHRFQLDFADARSKPWRKSGIWRYYPRPWAVFQGPPTDLRVSGPGLGAARIPPEWFVHEPDARPAAAP